MNRLLRFQLLRLLLIYIVFCQTSRAQNNFVNLSDSANEYDVYKQLYTFEDINGTVNFEDVLDSNSSIPFQINSEALAPNLGFTKSNFWFKLKLKNSSNAKSLILEFPYPFFNKLVLYIPDSSGKYLNKTVGDHLPFMHREILHKNFLFQINFNSNEQKIIYAHLYCNGEATSFPIRIVNSLKLAENNYVEQLTLGFYYGILVFAILLSLFLGASLKEKINYKYFLYIISIGLFQLSLDGLAFQYIWPNNVWLANHIIPIAGSFAIFFLIKFTQDLLFTKKYTPKLSAILNLVAAIDVVLFLVSLLENPFYAFSLKALNLIGLVANILILITSIIIYRNGYRPARYFLIAFTLLILGSLTALMKNFGFLPRVFITEYGIQIGSGVEIIFLSFALSERVKVLKDEKQEAQNQLFLQLQENNRMQINLNIELEQKVIERTIEIQEQNKVISEKNKDITDSINYAKRIQEAMLSKAEAKSLNGNNHFILFKPRDIVSGDFYWYTEQKNKLIIAAVDCTGHGVPGSLMSMIGSTLLSKVVNDLEETKPARILELLDVSILDALKQKIDYNANNDGMDMAICAIDYEMKTIEYAGAQRPLYFVRNNELISYKPSSFSIGGYLAGAKKVFTSEIIPFQTNDMVYLFSDGYADQFGGSQNKKFMTKNMKQLLAEVSNLDVEIQKQKIEEAFESWKGNNVQIDDVLVIGLKL